MKLFKHGAEPWQIAAARYIVGCEHGSTMSNLKAKLIELGYELHDIQVSAFWGEEVISPAGRKFSRSKVNPPGEDSEHIYQAPLDLVQKITDYDELKEARINAKNAFWLSVITIIIAFVTLAITAIS